MNSRLRRKEAAEEFNNRRVMVVELRQLQQDILQKHGIFVPSFYGNSCAEVYKEITRLMPILDSDIPPPRRVGSRATTRLQLAAIAAMAGIGHIQ